MSTERNGAVPPKEFREDDGPVVLTVNMSPEAIRAAEYLADIYSTTLTGAFHYARRRTQRSIIALQLPYISSCFACGLRRFRGLARDTSTPSERRGHQVASRRELPFRLIVSVQSR